MASYWVFLLNNTNIPFLKSVSNAAQLKLLENQTQCSGKHKGWWFIHNHRLLPLPSVISKDSRKRSSSLMSASASYKTKVGTIKAFPVDVGQWQHLYNFKIQTPQWQHSKVWKMIHPLKRSHCAFPSLTRPLTSTWNPRTKAFTKSAALVRALTSLVSLQVWKRGTHTEGMRKKAF